MMKKTLKSLISVMLVLCMMVSTAITASAASYWDEEYLSDLRLIYADTYKEAKLILSETKLEGYDIYDENLNENTDEIGVWLAYKTTTDVDEAITDIAVMQMNGGYQAGNYQEMLKQSRDDYLKMGEIYLQAIRYFAKAYRAGNFFAQSAYRQLNFYNGLDFYKTKKLGDLFVGNLLTTSDLATLFLQGNTQVLQNIRSLLAMGVSYNEDGLHYLEKVGVSAEKMNANQTVFYGKNYDSLAALIAPSIVTFGNMFDELSTYESELNYTDETFTDLEIKYSEYKAIAEMMRAVKYLNNQTLYDFCVNYSLDTNDYSSLYPLVDALNAGQIAVTKLFRYYEVVRYSMDDAPKEIINEEISKLEEKYGATPFDVYTGVDRDIYKGTFALTNKAYRTNAYDDDTSLAESLFGDGLWDVIDAGMTSGAIGVGLSVWEIAEKSGPSSQEVDLSMVTKAIDRYGKLVLSACEAIGGKPFKLSALFEVVSPNKTLGEVVYGVLADTDDGVAHAQMTFLDLCEQLIYKVIHGNLSTSDKARAALNFASSKISEAKNGVVASQASATPVTTGILSQFSTLLYFSSAITTAYTAISMCRKIYNYHHPAYDDIPLSIVDVVNTESGDKYVKYDVVYEAQPQKNGDYAAGDLNAFEGQRWNALYYTKDAHAGSPLLAEFVLSNNDNRADEYYSPVHHFGEIICYDLNKYNFSSGSDSIFLSVEKSENAKSTIEDVPDVVGSIFGTGFLFIVVGVGIVFGTAGTLGTQFFLNKQQKKDSNRKVDEGEKA